MKTYAVKEIFGPTIQGEGTLTGTVTWFVRFAGCNMWDGREETKATSACPYCDTDFFGGEKMTAETIVALLKKKGMRIGDWVTLSGGEPMLQVDDELLEPLEAEMFHVALETNGTKDISKSMAKLIDHVTVSPKVPMIDLELTWADDLKLLYPHPNTQIRPDMFGGFSATHRYLQPVNEVDCLDEEAATQVLTYIYEHTEWKLSIQLHKILGVE